MRLNEPLLIRAAYFEWRVARAYSTGTTVEIEPRQAKGAFLHPALSASWPSRRFVREELGFGLDTGPSLAWTCSMLDKANRDACKVLGTDAPHRYTWPLKRSVRS